MEMPSTDAAGFVRALAEKHGIDAKESQHERMLKRMAEIAGEPGSEVQLDQTEQLLVKLAGTGVIDNQQLSRLMALHFYEKAQARLPGLD